MSFSNFISDLFLNCIWPAVDYICMAILVLYAAKISRNPACCELSFDQCLRETCFKQSREDLGSQGAGSQGTGSQGSGSQGFRRMQKTRPSM